MPNADAAHLLSIYFTCRDQLGVATALYKEGFLLIVEDDEDNDTHDAVAETSEVGSGAASRRDENESGDGEDSEGEGL